MLSPCALASTSVKKGKKRVGPGEEDGDGIGIGEELGGLYGCVLICENMSSCWNHLWEEGDYRGGVSALSEEPV